MVETRVKRGGPLWSSGHGPRCPSRGSTGLASPGGVLLPLPRRLRPFLLDLVLTVWTILELTYLAGLGDASWHPAHPGVRLEPQPRATALTLLVGRPEVADAGLTRWVFPVWRFSPSGGATDRPDALDLAIGVRSSGCVRPSRKTPGPLGSNLREHAAAVWLVRHWTVDEMLDVWTSCQRQAVPRAG
jgi:hypothetical protein